MNRRPYLYWSIHLGVWLFGGLALGLVFIRFLPVELSFLRTLPNLLLLVVLFYGNNWLVRHFFIPKNYKVYFSWAALLLVLVTLFRAQLNLQFIDYQLDFLLQNNLQGLQITALISNLGLMFVGIIYELSRHRAEVEKHALEARNRQQEAQLQYLRAQINPHFLFNTLNNIYALAVLRSEQTAPMVLQLSELLRYVIYESQQEKVSLQKEVEQIERFIELFRMRSESPLNITFRYQDLPRERFIEPMMLIPLVENCFKHCDFDTNPEAYVRIRLQIAHRELEFETVNSKNDELRQKDKVGGVGLENIRQRLELKYPDRYHMEVDNQEDAFRVRLQLLL
jgi:sensor histidine kinase YesM